MIARLTGKVEFISTDYLILDVNGVGYKVESPAPFRLGRKDHVSKIEIYTVVKETELRLIGFASRLELVLFELMLKVSGVGPKSAMLIVANYSPRQIKQAILLRDAKALSVKGVGKKTLEKLIIELADKIKNVQIHSSNNSEDPEDNSFEGNQEQAHVSDSDNDLIASSSGLNDTNNQKEYDSAYNDLHLGLTSLGYNTNEVNKIIDKIDFTKPFSDQIKQAFKLINQ